MKWFELGLVVLTFATGLVWLAGGLAVLAGLLLGTPALLGALARLGGNAPATLRMALRDLAKTARRLGRTVTAGDDAVRAMSVILRKLAGFTGLVHENMYRFSGWRFLEVGRRIERGVGDGDAPGTPVSRRSRTMATGVSCPTSASSSTSWPSAMMPRTMPLPWRDS